MVPPKPRQSHFHWEQSFLTSPAWLIRNKVMRSTFLQLFPQPASGQLFTSSIHLPTGPPQPKLFGPQQRDLDTSSSPPTILRTGRPVVRVTPLRPCGRIRISACQLTPTASISRDSPEERESQPALRSPAAIAQLA